MGFGLPHGYAALQRVSCLFSVALHRSTGIEQVEPRLQRKSDILPLPVFSMGASTPPSHEQTAVDLVLGSGIFDKAPRLGNFFRYICERHLQGDGDQIKEYSIALEALGRPPDFDPKKDSIVRVEAHRLRRPLETYYRGAGANQRVQIVIPNGQYRPQFIFREVQDKPTEMSSTAAPAIMADPKFELPQTRHGPAFNHSRWFGRIVRRSVLLPVLLIAVSGTVLVLHGFQRQSPGASSKSDDTWTGPSSNAVPAEFRILAGYHGAPFLDRQGHTWGPDAYYTGGSATPIPPDRLIDYQPDPHLLKSQRMGKFHYDIPLGSGTHELRLYFVETEYGHGNPQGGGESSHLFQISVNGVVTFALMDLLAESGAPNRLYVCVLKDVGPGPDGKLHLNFNPVSGPAVLSGIEILQSSPGRIHPVRIVAQTTPVTDSDGRLWAADEYVSGGALVCRPGSVLNPPEKALYQGERYGNFSYRIPLAPGKYRLTLHFAETWFGTPASRYADVNSRCFDVYANGVSLLRNYRVAQDAGGPDRSVTKVFRNVEPNAQGLLLLNFVPVKNYAEVNAIEVVETN